jgi:phage-related protein
MGKEIFWEGDSYTILKGFPRNVKINIGHDLRRLQEGEKPLDSKPMASIDKGVFELRDRDGKGWYRVIYYIKIKNKIHVLHSFIKKSAKTPKNDLSIAITRLKNLKSRMKRGEDNEK